MFQEYLDNHSRNASKTGASRHEGRSDRMCRFRSNLMQGLFVGLLLAGLWAPASSAESLTDFRKPSDLETAYIGAAAQLVEPALCEKISEKALYRGRKPILARSRCFYYIAINTGMLNWCDKVTEVPVALGMMNWLEPKRCRFQVKRIRGNRVYKTEFDRAVLFEALGYKAADVPASFKSGDRVDWSAFFDFIVARRDPEANRIFSARLEKLPDLSVVERPQDRNLYFTHKEEVYEFVNMASHGLKLCLYGQGSDNCTRQNVRKMRARLNEVRNSTKSRRFTSSRRSRAVSPSGGGRLALRRPTQLEKAYYDLALGLQDRSICRRISPDTLAVGWTTEPGLLFMPLRAICLTAVAYKSGNIAMCDEVVPLARDDLDGADLTPARCRQVVEHKAPSPHRPFLSSDWKTSLHALGFSESDLSRAAKQRPGEKFGWKDLALWSMEEGTPYNTLLRTRLAAAADFGHGNEKFDPNLRFTEAALQKHLYQLTLIRFHCSLRGNPTPRDDKAVAPAPSSLAGHFSLTSQKGERVTDRTYRGKFLLIYFGYTHCPDLCPTDLSKMVEALNIVGPEVARKVAPVFVTLDPRRDTVRQMAEYVDLFDPRLQGLTGSEAEIRQAARGYKVYYYAGNVDGTYVVDHTAYTYLVGPDGRHLAFFKHGADVKDIAATITRYVNSKKRVASVPNKRGR